MSKLCFEFEARWARPKEMSEEDQAIRETNRILGREPENPEDIISQLFEYVYNPLVIDLNDVKNFNKLDEEHTTIRQYEGDVFVIHLSFDTFASIYGEITGVKIRTMDTLNFETEEGDNS